MSKAKVIRSRKNPLITPADVLPSAPDFVVEGVFNCAAAKYNDEYILLCRVAESVKTRNEDEIAFPVVNEKNGENAFAVVTMNKKQHPELDFSDSRTIINKSSKKVEYLTSLSHIRVARSNDGTNFKVDEKPTIIPNSNEECWGMEDPRITKIEDTFYINYTAVSPNGAATALITTKDFKSFNRHGIIFLPENKDVAIFSQKIDGDYYAFNRPVPNQIGNPDIWISTSPDLIHWGAHKHFLGVSENGDGWDNSRLGGGAPPVLIDEGWLFIYHGADKSHRYSLGAMLLDKKNPEKILGKGKLPLLEPCEGYEKEGFFPNVVFSCGCILENDMLIIYYGAADDKICRADIAVSDVLNSLS